MGDACVQLEIEAGLGATPIFALVEGIQPRGTLRDVLLDLVGLDQEVHGERALADVPLVELSFEHPLVQMLKLRERELPAEHLDPDRLVPELSIPCAGPVCSRARGRAASPRVSCTRTKRPGRADVPAKGGSARWMSI